jgi:hypothetical protein
VRPGGTLLTPVGQLEIGEVARVTEGSISAADARRAGYASLYTLQHELNQRAEGSVYRIELKAVRPDPRIALRATTPDEADMGEVLRRLGRLDAQATPWTSRVLDLIAGQPGVRAGDLCRAAGMTKEVFKLNVRKLKGLGLTESLGTGYRLSPRGAVVRARVGSIRSPRPRNARR